jgi:hypothetical protein
MLVENFRLTHKRYPITTSRQPLVGTAGKVVVRRKFMLQCLLNDLSGTFNLIWTSSRNSYS